MEHKLIAYYEQKLDASEIAEVEQWLLSDAMHQKIYEDTIRIWQDAKQKKKFTQLDKTQAWEKLQQKIAQQKKTPAKGKVFHIKWWQASAAAAAAIFIILFFNTKNQDPVLYTANDISQNIKLPDNTNIVLYPNTTLEVSNDFNKKSRTVTLKGDAFFDIAKNPDKPFIINDNNMMVQVLGTSFTILHHKDFSTVYVRSGKVKASFQKQSVVAVAHQKIVMDNKNQQLQLVNMAANIDDILDAQNIRCKDMRIDSLAGKLQELYNITIETDPAIAGKKITSTYLPNEPIEDVLENIALTMNVSWSKQNNHYSISK